MLRTCRRPGLPALAALALAAAPGCFYYSDRTGNIDRTPTVDTGVGASILMPGQPAPPLGYGGAARSGPAGSSEAGSGPVGGQPAPAPQMTMIGGSSIDEQRNLRHHEEPLLFKWALTPLAVVAAPFKYVADKLRGDPEPGPKVPHQGPPVLTPAAAPATPRTNVETQRLDDMENELDRKLATDSGAPGKTAPRATGAGGANEPSIADELASLQRSAQAPEAPRQSVAQPAESDATAAEGAVADGRAADGIVDRNGDGRIDQWIYRRGGDIEREVLDENYDGRPDTTRHYDLATHQVDRIEEDTDHDGTTDSWTDLRDGRVARRRVDTNHDGSPDTWIYYRDGEVTRHEEDTNGDGFRDRVGYYVGGRLAREEIDDDADGRVDATVYYDEQEHVTRREEDRDHDGTVDTISYYEDGRLARRELMGPATGKP